jgi:hypothetical protein
MTQSTTSSRFWPWPLPSGSNYSMTQTRSIVYSRWETTDNKSALGWIYRSSHIDNIARTLTLLVVSSNSCLASQHIEGDHNTVADLLSFSHQSRRGPKIHPLAAEEPLDETLTQRFHASLPQLVPTAFNISPLRSEILFFATQVLAFVESSWIRNKKQPMRNTTRFGDAGLTFATPPASPITSSSLMYPRTPANSSPEPSSRCTGPLPGTSQGALLANVDNLWLAPLSETPQASWLRHFGTITNGAPYTSRDQPSCSRPSELS